MQRFMYKYVNHRVFIIAKNQNQHTSTTGESPEVTHSKTLIQTSNPRVPSSISTNIFPSVDELDSLYCFPPLKN